MAGDRDNTKTAGWSIDACQAEVGGEAIPELSEELVGGSKGWAFGLRQPTSGRLATRFANTWLGGRARKYDARDSTELSDDGKWETHESGTAPYRARIHAVVPKNLGRFSGVVVVHWNNVTAGFDLGDPGPVELLRAGHSWVGVTAQKVGVDGFPDAGMSLAEWDSERYGTLEHPGDAFSFDIFGQVARAIREKIGPFAGVPAEVLIATGGSQSAGRLAGYINGVHPHDGVFDAFMPTVHGGFLRASTNDPERSRATPSSATAASAMTLAHQFSSSTPRPRWVPIVRVGSRTAIRTGSGRSRERRT
jgi:Alpha/beta hydrolase domain